MADNSESEWEAYYPKLGRFYHAYTDLEHQLTCGISLVVTEGRGYGVEYDVAVAVLGGMRMSPLKDTTKRLMRILGTPADRRGAVDRIFAHLGDIQFFRDRLAHHHTRPVNDRPGIWRNDDYAAIREHDKSKKLEFHIDALGAASEDLEAIKFLLDSIYVEYLTPPKGVIYEPPLDPENLPAWRYKPSMLSPHRRNKSDSRGGSLPPPQS